MPDKRIYFDNAATSFPKPDAVYKAMDYYARLIGASAGRGAYREAVESGEIITDTRQRLARLINAPVAESIIFTFNCTDGLSIGIKGLVGRSGDHVITTRMDHNSVLRPLYRLERENGIEVTYVSAEHDGLVDPDNIRKAIQPNTRLIAVVHGSNVCGSMQDIDAISGIAREYGVPLLVDAAQTIGHMNIDVQALQIDMLAFPGHKGLLGPLGTGGLYIRPGFEQHLTPLREGGTGSKSEDPFQPEIMPDWFESGSHNALGLAGLQASLIYLQKRGLDNIRKHEKELIQLFLDGTAGIDRLKVYGPRTSDRQAGAISVSVFGYPPNALAAILETRYGLLTRPGLHCAPFAHQTIGSFDLGGTVRFSMGPFLEKEHVKQAVEALLEISYSPEPVF